MKHFFPMLLFLLAFLPCLYGGDGSQYKQIERYVLGPFKLPPLDKWDKNFMRTNEEAFIRRLGMTHDEFSAVIIEQYKKTYMEPSNHLHRVLTRLLPNLTDTNTIPFVRAILADDAQTAYWGDALYILARRGEDDDFEWFRKQVFDNRLEDGQRGLFYAGCRHRFSGEIVKPDPYTSFRGNPRYEILREALEKEPSWDARMQIDMLFNGSLKGWRTSEEREILLRRWLAEFEGQGAGRVVTNLLKEQAKARETGDTMVYCERPPYRAPSPEEVEQQKKKSAEERAARMQTPYEGPLVVDMDEQDEQ